MTETIPLTPQTGKSDNSEDGRSRLPLRLIDLILMVALAAGALMAFRYLLHPREVTTGAVIAFLLGQNAVLLGIVWLVAIAYRGTTLRQLGFVHAQASWYRRVVPVAIFLQIVVVLTNVLISMGLGKPFENPQIPLIMPDPRDWGAMIGMFIATTIVAPVVEELTLRSVLYGWLRKHLSPVIAGIISAAAFAALHGSLVLLPGTFLVGLTLAWTYERSGSIFPGMLVHGCFNAISTLLVFAVAIGQAG
jgi:membrane protease YdiL (CAAX protease family)